MKKKNNLKKLIAILVAINMIFVLSIYADAVEGENIIRGNQLINPSFENGTSGWDIGWNWSVTSEQAHSGLYSLKCTGYGGWSNTYQTVFVVPNSQYTLSFYAKTTITTIYKIIGGSTNLTGDLCTNSTNLWTKYSVTINSGNNSTVNIYVADAGGTLYFDDFQFVGPSTVMVERTGDKLTLNGNDFRFVGANSFYLHDNPYTNDYTSQFVINDIFKTCNEMGINVVRFFPNWAGSTRSLEPTIGSFNTTSFEHLDYVIKAASDYGVKLIIPLSDYYTTLDTFAGWRGVDREQFNTNSTVINDFKGLIYNILNRVNSYTGVAYKDAPAILCWETGNEVRPPYSWTSNIAAYIKSIDLNHLVMDGNYGVDSNALFDDNIDIVSSHFYLNGDYASDLRYFRNFTKNIKPFIGGEFGDNTDNRNTQYTNLLNEAISNGVSGICVWNLFGHRDDGGFQQHRDTFALHYPGDDAYMNSTMDIIRNGAYAMRGLLVPNKSVPLPPTIVKSISAPYGMYIQYKGSVGATTYTIERSSNYGGSWTILSSSETENEYDYIGYLDKTASVGTLYYYRIKAINASGTSSYSSNLFAKRISATNLVRNPGFELDATNWTMGWNWSISSTYKYSGSKSLYLDGSMSWSNAYQTINVAQNANYVLSFYAKSTDSTLFKVMDSKFSSDLSLTHYTNSSNQWTRYDIRFNSGSNSSVNILLADGGGSHYFDNFNLFQIPSIAFSEFNVSKDGTNIITNIQPNSTVEDFLSPSKTIVDEGTVLIFKNSNGITIGPIDKIGTGTIIEVYVSNIKINTYTILIYGDVNGDGTIDLYDLVVIRDNLIEFQAIDEKFAKAGDFYNEGSVTLNSLVAIMACISEAGNINQNQFV